MNLEDFADYLLERHSLPKISWKSEQERITTFALRTLAEDIEAYYQENPDNEEGFSHDA